MLAQLRRSLKRSAKRSAKKTRRALVTKKGKRGSRKQSKRKSKRSKGQGGGKSKKANPYMKALQAAQKSQAPTFSYNGKTYHRKKAKTGMPIYSLKK